MEFLGKRKCPFECQLMIEEGPGSWLSQSYGEVALTSINGQALVLFTAEDGSEYCWRVDEAKHFRKESSVVSFEADSEERRGFKLQPEDLPEFWGRLQVALRIENGELQPSPSGSTQSNLAKIYSRTTLQAMSAAKFSPQSLEHIMGLLEDRPDAAVELLCSNSQIFSLEQTFQTLRDRGQEGSEGLSQLAIIVKKILLNLNRITVNSLIGGNTWLLVLQILASEPEQQFIPDLTPPEEKLGKLDKILPLGRSVVRENLMLNFKLLYLRECVFNKTIDDKAVKHLNELLNENYIQILVFIFSSPQILNQLVQKIRQGNLDAIKILFEISEFMVRPDALISTSQTLNKGFESLIKDYRLLDYLLSKVIDNEIGRQGIDKVVDELEREPMNDELESKLAQSVAEVCLQTMSLLGMHKPWFFWNHCLTIGQRSSNQTFIRQIIDYHRRTKNTSVKQRLIDIFSSLLVLPPKVTLPTSIREAREEFIHIWSGIEVELDSDLDERLLMMRAGCKGASITGDVSELLSSVRNKEQLSNIVKSVSSLSTDQETVKVIPSLLFLLESTTSRGRLLNTLGQFFMKISIEGFIKSIELALSILKDKKLPSRKQWVLKPLYLYKEKLEQDWSAEQIRHLFSKEPIRIEKLERQKSELDGSADAAPNIDPESPPVLDFEAVLSSYHDIDGIESSELQRSAE